MIIQKSTLKETIFQTILKSVFGLISIITIYPFLNILARSLSTGKELVGKSVFIVPVMATLENYKAIFLNSMLSNALMMSLLRTSIGTLCHLIVVGFAAYACSKRGLKGKRLFMLYFMIPMYFSGGLLPSYILINSLHLRNNFLVYILPGMFSTFNFLIMVTYFRSLPDSFEESAIIDGASYLKVFFKIILPLSAPIIATITLFAAVSHWNSYFDTLIYVSNLKLYTLQPILYSIIREAQASAILEQAKYGMSGERKTTVTSESIRMATMCFTIIPILCVYPFLQKYFIKGVMIGGIKG